MLMSMVFLKCFSGHGYEGIWGSKYGVQDQANSDLVAWISNAYSAVTRTGMGIAEHLWSNFALDSGFHLNVYLVGVVKSQGAYEVVRFIQSLTEDHCMLDGAVSRILTSLRAVFVRNFGNDEIFDTAILTAARKAVKGHRTLLSDGLLADSPVSRCQLPLSLDMLLSVRGTCWVAGDMKDKMLYMAMGVMMMRGLRVSHVANTGSRTYANGGRDHRFRLSDLSLDVTAHGLVTPKSWKSVGCPGVQALILRIPSSKTHGPELSKRCVPPMVLVSGVGSESEQQLMSDLVTWISISGMTEPTDLLFACLSPQNPKPYKMLMSKDVCLLVKSIARSFGFNPDLFSSRSVRIGANTELAAQGATDGERMSVLDHATLSVNSGYLRGLQERNPFSSDGALRAADVVRMARYV